MNGPRVLAIYTNRALQYELFEAIHKEHPKAEPVLYVRKSLDISQIITIAFDAANLAVSIAVLAVQLRGKSIRGEQSGLTLEIKDGDRNLKIEIDNGDVDVEKIVSEFLEG